MGDEKVITPEELAALKEENASLKEKLTVAEKDLFDAYDLNASFEKRIEELESIAATVPEAVKEEKKKVVLPTESFKVDGEEHVFIVPRFTNPLSGHTVITAEEALTNKELLEHLVKNDCGVTERKVK